MKGSMWRYSRWPLTGAMFFLAAVSLSQSQDSAADRMRAYASAIEQAVRDLDQGRVAEAKLKLEATNPDLRSFEYVYLMARADGSGKSGTAPDLIQTIAKPEDVETRHGVLNEVNRQMVFICRDGGMRIHDLTSPAAPPSVATNGLGNAIWTGVFSRDGKVFATGHERGDFVLWDAKTWKVRHTVSLKSDRPVRELAIAPDGSSLAAEGKDELELWSLAGNQPKKIGKLAERYNFGEGLAYSPRGDLIATGGMFDIELRDAKTAEKTKSIRHASYTMGLEFSPDGARIASAPRGNVNKFLGVFDVASGQALFNAGPFGHYVVGLAFTPDGRRIAATGCEKVLRLFDAATGVVVLTWPRVECGARPAFSRDGNLLGWSEPDGFKYIDLARKADDKK